MENSREIGNNPEGRFTLRHLLFSASGSLFKRILLLYLKTHLRIKKKIN